MKIYITIFSLMLLLFIGCSSTTIALRESQIDGMRPFMERTEDEDKINIALPIYKF